MYFRPESVLGPAGRKFGEEPIIYLFGFLNNFSISVFERRSHSLLTVESNGGRIKMGNNSLLEVTILLLGVLSVPRMQCIIPFVSDYHGIDIQKSSCYSS